MMTPPTARQLRIGFITGEYLPMTGGVGAFTHILARTLASQGHEIHVLTDERGYQPHAGITLNASVRGWGLAALRMAHTWAAGLDVVAVQYQTAAYGMSPVVHWLPDVVHPIPVVTTFHDLRYPYLFPKAGGLRPWIVRRLARASAGVIATNHEDSDALGFHPHAALIPIGSNIASVAQTDADRAAVRLQLGIDADTFTIAYFGFINTSKGVATLIDALNLAAQSGLRWRVIMIGDREGASDPTNRAYAAQIDHQIARYGLQDAVLWTGYADEADVSAYLYAANCIALPYRDGASLRRGTLMAALTAGRPIITTRPSVAIPDFIDGENMLLVSPDDAPALLTTLRRLAEDSLLQHHLSAGAGLLANNFGWDEIARRTVDHLLAVITTR